MGADELAFAKTVTTGVEAVTADTLLASEPLADPMPESATALRAGSVIKHYELIRKLGQGGMGMVFLARDTRLGRLVAIKFLLDQKGQHTERFLAEARATAQCKHENIVVIYEVDEVYGCPFMVLEYIQGQTLRAWMDQRMRPDPSDALETAAGPVSPSVAVELMLPVVRALDCAHRLGIVHRDLKPENILLSDAGQVKVVDFGIAKHVSFDLAPAMSPAPDMLPASMGLTEHGAIVGTLPYMSPEQRRQEPLDARTDIWSAGILLFELLTGAHPLDPLSLPKLAMVTDLDTPMPSARDKRPHAGPLADLVDRCLKKRRDDRIGSAKELAEALERLGAEKGIPELAEDESPFAGLSAFQESDAARFFGRDHDIAGVIGRLRNQELLAIAGPSGAGKSSFVRAGVIPALKRSHPGLEAFVVRPGRQPLAALADVLAFITDTAHTTGEANPAQIAEILQAQPGYLGARLRARCRRRGSDHRIVLFIDQLEELYTLGIEPNERAAFCACLEGVADDASSPLRVLVAIRADFLDRLTDDRRLLAEVTQGLVFLPPMPHDSLRDALQKPLEAARYRFEDDELAGEMLRGLEGTKSPLPILQFTASKLWEARDRERRLLTRQAYHALGGVAGALSTHADAVLSSMAWPEQRLARLILTRLVTPERTRAIVRLEELCALSEDAAAVAQVVDLLAAARLLAVEAGGEREGKTVELAHESLIERWAKLRQWLDASEQDAQFLVELRNAAMQWEKNGEPDDFLWRDRAALQAGQWLERRRAEGGVGGTSGLGKREERYLEAVVRLAERTRRWRRRMAAALFAGLSLVVLVVSALAVQSSRQAARAEAEKAEAQAQRAEAQAQRAQAEGNAARARNATRLAAARERQQDPTTVLALLREIEPGSVPRAWTELSGWARGAGVAKAVLPHNDVLYSVEFSPDAKRLVTSSRDQTVWIWNADGSGQPLVLKGHTGRVTAASFSPDGRHIVSASADKTIRVWNADGSGKPLVLQGHAGQVTAVAYSPDGRHIVSASRDKTLRLWSADGSGQPLVLEGHTGGISSAAFSPDGRRIVTAARDKTLRVWNAGGSGKPLVLKGHDDSVQTAAFSSDGLRVVSASTDKTVRVWNADGSGQPLILKHDGPVGGAVFSPDGQHIVSSSSDKTVRVWNADGSGQPRVFEGHNDGVYTIAFSPDGRHIASGSFDKTVRIWDLQQSGRPLLLQGHDDAVNAAAFSPDGRHILTASADKTVRVWNVDDSRQPSLVEQLDSPVVAAAFSPDGQRIVAAMYDGTVRVWNADGSGQRLVLKGHAGPVEAAAFSPDGLHIVSASADRTVRVWNAGGSGEPVILNGHTDEVWFAAFSPDGRRIVTASFDKTVRVWNADGSGQPILLNGHDHRVWSAAFSPDGRHIVSASEDKTVRLWNADGSGQPLVFKGHEATALVRGDRPFSPDGRRIVSSSNDGTVRIWNADGTGEPIVLRPSDKPVNMASWSPDGRRIVAASDDKTVIVWSDLVPLQGADDPRLWDATTYCMPLDIRRRLLDFPEEQSRADLERCQRLVAETRK